MASSRLESQEEGWTTKIHLLAQDAGRAIAFRLSPGHGHDAAEGEVSAVVPAKSNRLDPWESDQEHDQKRNEVERLFSRRKGFGRIFSGLDQLDLMFSAFWFLVLMVDSLRSC